MKKGVVERGRTETWQGKEEPEREDILQQLEKLVHSVHFRNSRRYPTLLRFVVERTLAGDMDQLKERTLGMAVFGRRPDYDTNADPIVRFTAGEIRKRIAQYYMAPEHLNEIRIELPLGSYVPHFSFPDVQPSAEALPEVALPSSEDTTASEHKPDADLQNSVSKPDLAAAGHHVSKSPHLLRRLWKQAAGVLLAILVGSLCLAGMFAHPWRQGANNSLFWRPLLASSTPCMIVLGVHSLGPDGVDRSPASQANSPEIPQSMMTTMVRSEMVPISDVVSFGHLTDLLARNNHAYTTRSASQVTLDQIRRQPVILVGGFDNIWTMRLTSALRFRFMPGEQMTHEILDSQHPATRWTFDGSQNALSNSEDYGIVSEFFDPQIEQIVIVIAGIGKDGTEAAAEFATSSDALTQWLKAGPGQSRKQFEVVVSTQIIDGQHGPPHIVASDTW